MAVRILVDLEASPDTVELASLPLEVNLHQVLASDRHSESVTIVYSVAGGGNVCFAGGELSRTFNGVKLSNVATAINQQVTLAHCAGDAMAQIEIDQLITSADGSVRRDLTHVIIA